MRSEVGVEERLAALVAEMYRGGILYKEALAAFRGAFISAALRENNGNLSKAAPVLGLHRNTLTRLCFELQIDLSQFRAKPRRPPGSARTATIIKRAAR